MAKKTEISWTDSTFNPWLGCTKVGPGCDHCYAEALMDVRHKRVVWGAGETRVRTSADNWNAVRSWNKHPFYECLDCGARFAPKRRKEGYVTCPGCGDHGGRLAYDKEDAARVKEVRRRVFCASLADVFDNEVDPAWRADLFALIHETPNIDWLVLTKRVGNVLKMIEGAADYHFDHGDRNVTGWLHDWYRHGLAPAQVWLGATVVNQEEADRDIPKLLAVPARVRFLSIEPMLSAIDLTMFLYECCNQPTVGGEYMGAKEMICCQQPVERSVRPDWIIAGGESGHNARPMHPDWIRSLRDQCSSAGVPFHFKQHGEWVGPGHHEFGHLPECAICVIDSAGRVLDPPPQDENADALTMKRVGKKAAGRLLDGREWNGFP